MPVSSVSGAGSPWYSCNRRPAGEAAGEPERAARESGPAALSLSAGGKDAQGVEGVQKIAEEGECQACKERKYQDGSNDPGVSYKTPTAISAGRAASAVRAHEMEHVTREQAKARREGREIVSQTVTLHTGICPECGRAYVSGGTTRTASRAAPDPSRFQVGLERREGEPFTKSI